MCISVIVSPALPAFDEPARSLQDQGTEYAALHDIHDSVGQQGPTADSKDHTHMSVSQITSQLADADTTSPSTPTVTLVLPAVDETSRPLEVQETESPTSQELFGQQGRAAHDQNLPIPQIISADTNENSFSTPIVFPASPVISDSKVTSRPELPSRQRNPFNGREKSLVIAIDIGTTFSGVSYALLEPEKVPQIRSVARFAGQKEQQGASKVPSVVCYDQSWNVVAAGSETDLEMNPALSDINGVMRVERFKLRLRPSHLAADKRTEIEKLWSPPEPADEELDDYEEYLDEPEDEDDIILEIEGTGAEVTRAPALENETTD
ncbi:hypothetical protein M378DRAFT_345727 [Amanita muscaria Koide BX008]|uniref:Uncharacterized protein n=1 Tax=Amanita muscaria (strain Koide BX008) TaxID=946122 RepID=A0A0C2S5N5_AMAMK|nr:hypothetical protein M378DRAFT_345727 [Amanita muscaria Koide BX008]